MACRLVFFLDVDNTLIENDGLRAAISRAVADCGGAGLVRPFWETYEAVRVELDLVHWPTILARLRRAYPDVPGLGGLERALYEDLDFAAWLVPGALDTIDHLRSLGKVIVTSDGDEVYQVAKIRRSGIAARVDGVVVAPHKEARYADLAAQHPADRYIIVDDKAAILAAARAHFGTRAFTVHVRLGKYATTPETAPDLAIAGFGELVRAQTDWFCPTAVDGGLEASGASGIP